MIKKKSWAEETLTPWIALLFVINPIVSLSVWYVWWFFSPNTVVRNYFLIYLLTLSIWFIAIHIHKMIRGRIG